MTSKPSISSILSSSPRMASIEFVSESRANPISRTAALRYLPKAGSVESSSVTRYHATGGISVDAAVWDNSVDFPDPAGPTTTTTGVDASRHCFSNRSRRNPRDAGRRSFALNIADVGILNPPLAPDCKSPYRSNILLEPIRRRVFSRLHSDLPPAQGAPRARMPPDHGGASTAAIRGGHPESEPNCRTNRFG